MENEEKISVYGIIKRIKINSFFSFISIISRLIANVFVFWIMARFFSEYTFGQFTYAHTLATTFILFADFGFDVLLTTEVARNRKNAEIIFSKYFSIKFLLTSISFLVMWFLILLKNNEEQGFLITSVFTAFMVFSTLTNFFNALLRGFEKLNYESIVSLVSNILLIILIILLIIINAHPFLFALSFVLTRGIGLITSIFLAKKLISKVIVKISFENFRDSFIKVFDFGMVIIFAGLLFQLDTVLIGLFLNDLQVGIYQAAVKIIMLPLIIPSILFNAILPMLAKFNAENEKKWASLSYYMNKILILLSAPISVIIFVYPEQILNIVYGYGKFNQAIPILKIFAFVLFVRFFYDTYGYMLTTSNRQRTQMFVLIIAISINFLCDLLIIPKFGVIGVALISLLTNMILAFGYCYFNFIFFKKWILNYRFFFLFIIFCITIIFFSLVDNINFWFGTIIIFAIFFITGIYFFFDKKEKTILLTRNFNK